MGVNGEALQLHAVHKKSHYQALKVMCAESECAVRLKIKSLLP